MSNAPKRGLGRGLGALLGDAPVSSATPGVVGEIIRHIPVDRVRPNPHQPRKTFDPATLDELGASIQEHGVLVPILVRERGDGYELIAGERRWRACAALSQATIPAIVRPSTDLQSLEVAIIENLQRENLNPLEEAAGMAELIDAHDFTQDQVAQRLGKSRPSVTNALRLLTLPEPIKAMIADGRLSAGHAKALVSAPENARLELANRVVREGLSVRVLERVVAALAEPPVEQVKAPPRTLSPEEREFESRLRVRVGSRVALRRSGRGGTIEIAFASEPELIRIAEILLDE
jgi:ParB family transcriptional regulator, chromosome partitioning protein